METIRASTVAALGLSLLIVAPAPVAAQAKPQQTKPKAQPTTAPRAQAADPDYTPALADAETALDKKNYARAEKLLKQVLAENSKNPRAWFYLGSVYAATDRKAEAIGALEKSVALKPKVFESNLNLGLLLASAGKNEQAANHLRTATQLKPSNRKTADQEVAYAWISLGRLQEADPAAALEAFAQASRLTPKSPEPHLEAAQLLEKQKKYGEAEREYQQALGLRPKSTEALAGLVNVYVEQKRFPDAEATLREYIAADPSNLAAQKQLGRIYAALGRHDEAIAVFTKVLTISPADGEAKRELADMAANARKYDVAEKIYRELVQATPRDAGTHLGLGTALMKQRKFPEAEAELLQAVKLDPKLGEGYGNLAIVAAENKHYELALKALDARGQFLPEDATTYYLRATCFDHLKAFPQASENYRKFLELAEGKFPTQEWQARHRLIAIEPKK